MVSVVAVLGSSKSGKTATIEYLISNLTKEGYRIGCVKHVHHSGFSIDRKGTNTWRYAQAGSVVTVAAAPKEIAMIKRAEASLNDIDQVVGLLENENLDIVFLEGFHRLVARRNDIAKILVLESADDLANVLEGTSPPILAMTGKIAHRKSKVEGLSFPLIDLPSEGEKLLALVRSRLTGIAPSKS